MRITSVDPGRAGESLWVAGSRFDTSGQTHDARIQNGSVKFVFAKSLSVRACIAATRGFPSEVLHNR